MSSAADDTEAPTEPINPRRAPDVVEALARAAKRDPHRDIFKPIGRVAFVISLVVLAWLTLPMIEAPSADPHLRGNAPLMVLSRSIAVFQHVTQGILSIDPRRVIEFDLEPKQASMLMLGGLFGFGFYYLTVYIVAMNALRFSHGVGKIANAAIGRAHKVARRLRKPKDDAVAHIEPGRRAVPQVNEASS